MNEINGDELLAKNIPTPEPTFKVVAPDVSPESAQRLEKAFNRRADDRLSLTVHIGKPTTVSEWVKRTASANAIILGWRIPDEVLTESPHLKIITFLGTGVHDHVNVELAEKHGITVRNVAGYGDNAVAEHTLALLFAVANNIPSIDRDVRALAWPQPERWELAGKTVGIVGLGGIGRRFAELATGVGLNVVAWSRSLDSGAQVPGITAVSLRDLFRTADIVSLHLALNKSTEGIIGADLLNAMKPNSIFLNTARGGLVDSAALYTVLESGAILGAGLDVFDSEPLDSQDPIRSISRAVLTSHVAYNTIEASDTLIDMTVDNIQRFIAEG